MALDPDEVAGAEKMFDFQDKNAHRVSEYYHNNQDIINASSIMKVESHMQKLESQLESLKAAAARQLKPHLVLSLSLNSPLLNRKSKNLT
jgi:hypothetical protein